jgi:uncharacterized membrane protein YbhN (UPF0104 family)
LGWIFQTIFLKEARTSLGEKVWAGYSWSEQAQAAWQHGPPKLWSTLATINPGALALSGLLMGLTILLGIARWRVVLRVQGFDLPWGRAAEISFVAHFFNSFLLGSTGGDLMKAFYAARETHHKKTEAVVTVFVDRLIGLWAMLLFAGAMMLPNLTLLFLHAKLRSLALLTLAMLGACSGLVAVAFWGGVSRGWSGARAWLRRLPKGEWLERSLDSCRQFGHEPFFLSRTLVISMLLNAICVFQVWVIGSGLGLNIPPRVLFLIVPVIICISALPITPSGLGVRENLFVLMLAESAIGVPDASALSLSLLAYAGSLFWSLVGGLVYAMLKERHHLAEAELEKADPVEPACLDASSVLRPK